MAGEVVYEVKNVTKYYGHVLALDNASLQLKAGEVVGLVGDNGAGKSTMVKVLSGAHKPDSGEIILDGQQRHWASPREALDAGVETLYQDSSLAPHLTVAENVFLGREELLPGILGWMGFLNTKKMNADARRDLERVGIAIPPSGRTVTELSGGQRQAVAVGRAAAWGSKVLLLDEPTNHLGARQSMEVLEVIKAARNQGLAVMFISHTLPHVLEVCDRIVVMRLGRIAANRPCSDFDADSLIGTITGSANALSDEN